MPKLWTATIETHRHEVREALLDAVGTLLAAGGHRAVTMSAVAQAAGVGRATAYKYFPDAGHAVAAWHHRLVDSHLHDLEQLAAQHDEPADSLAAVLTAYAFLGRHHPGLADVTAMSHDTHAAAAERLEQLVRHLTTAGVDAEVFRPDIPVAPAARFCVRAMASAGDLGGKGTPAQLARILVDGLRRQ